MTIRPTDPPPPHVPTDAELCGLWPDPFAGPPDGPCAWPTGGPAPEPRAVAAASADLAGAAGGRGPLGGGAAADREPAEGLLAAGFTHRDRDPAGQGFAAGGVLDLLPPGPVLAGCAEDAVGGGLGRLSDDELIGFLCAARRLSSWQAALEFAAVIELDARREAQAACPRSSRADHVGEELAAALTVTGRSAGALLALARELARLPAVLAALAAGRIDRGRAAVFAGELAALSDRAAAAVSAAFSGEAGGMTTGQLRAALRRMVLAIDPAAAQRRAERGRTDARVQAWLEESGNGALSGRELPPAEMIAADQRIDAIARTLKAAGAAGSLDQLRAAVFSALLTGRDPGTLAPRPWPRPAGHRDPGPGGGPADWPGDRRAECRTGESAAGSVAGTSLAGSVNLTMPLAAWLGSSDAPGEVAGIGPLDAASCRELARSLAGGGRAQWCVTLTEPSGQAVAHACARAGPAPGPGRAGPAGAWLATLPFAWLESGPCSHRRQTPAYRPGRALRHLIQIRQRTCCFPGCRHPARRCDLDHTIPWDQGGRTCECGLATLCRRHHQTKQTHGWHLAQPEPGVLRWTLPHGRTYTVAPEPYPV